MLVNSLTCICVFRPHWVKLPWALPSCLITVSLQKHFSHLKHRFTCSIQNNLYCTISCRLLEVCHSLQLMNGPSHLGYKWFDQLMGLSYNLDIGWLVRVWQVHRMSAQRKCPFYFDYDNYGFQGMYSTLRKLVMNNIISHNWNVDLDRCFHSHHH